MPDRKVRVPGHSMAMSSYAGVIFSLDDFLLTSGGLATTETTLFLFNKELFRNLSAEDTVMEPIRVMTANKLATSGKEWARTFEQYNRYVHTTYINT